MLYSYKNIIDAKLENDNVPATRIFTLLVLNYGYKGKYGIVNRYVSSIKEKIIFNLTIRFETIKGYQAQVDWKEKINLHMTNKLVLFYNLVYNNNIFKRWTGF